VGSKEIFFWFADKAESSISSCIFLSLPISSRIKAMAALDIRGVLSAVDIWKSSLQVALSRMIKPQYAE
jgi:hypothetical protein